MSMEVTTCTRSEYPYVFMEESRALVSLQAEISG